MLEVAGLSYAYDETPAVRGIGAFSAAFSSLTSRRFDVPVIVWQAATRK